MATEIGKGDVLEAHVAAHWWQRHDVGRLLHLRHSVQDLKDALARGCRVQKGGNDHTQASHRLYQLSQVGRKRHQFAEGQLALSDQEATIPDDENQAGIGDQLNQGDIESPEASQTGRESEPAIVLAIKPSDLVLLLRKGLDEVAHALEVLLGAVGKPYYNKMLEVAGEAIGLVVEYIERAVKNPNDTEARTALGLATDLGGYAIMLGGTSGGHLTSFSLVDILSHGRACAIMNPYYTVFFAPAVDEPLRMVGNIFKGAGLTDADIDALSSRQLGVAVAEAMLALSKLIGFPTTLGEVKGFTDEHIKRALTAAKDPQLKMKLENMPVPLTAEMVDEYMRPILQAARDGDLSLIKTVP